jgi:hypothetical protein
MKTILAYGIACALGVAALGCGDDGGGSCETMSACGGNLVGTWKILSFCVDGVSDDAFSNATSFCSNASVNVGRVTAAGTMTFKSDMTVTESLTVSEDVNLNIPSSCLKQGGITLTCQQLNEATQAAAQNQDADAGVIVPSISCSGSGGGCACSSTVSEPVANAGTYTLSGNTVHMSFTAEDDDYCVQGNKLYLQQSKHTSMSMSSNTATFTLNGRAVLEKQ